MKYINSYIKLIALTFSLLLSEILFGQFVIDSVPTDPVSCVVGRGRIIVYTSGATLPLNNNYYLLDQPPIPGPATQIQAVTNSSEDTAVFSDVTAGTYYVYVTDQLGIPTGRYVTLSSVQNQELRTDSISVVVGPTCSFSSDAQLEAHASGGNPPYTYTWTGGAAAGPNKIATNLSAGFIYRVSVEDSYGCTSSQVGLPFYGVGPLRHDSVPLPLDEGSIDNSQIICYNTSPAVINSVVDASGERSFTYQWQDSVSGGSWADISGAVSASYNPPGNLTQTTYYRRAAIAGLGCGTKYSNTHEVTVRSEFLPGSIGFSQSICYDSIPAPFTSVVDASGGGTFDYQWQYSEVAGVWNNIGGATSAAYTETSNLTSSREYRRRATSTNGCGTVYSDTITITVYGKLQPGSIGFDQSICYDSVPAPFTSVAAASGGGTFDYEWQYREGAGPWIAIAGSNSATYTETTGLTTNREYRRAAQSTSGCDTVYSDTITITVYGQLQPGSIGSDQTICYDSVPAPFTSTVDASGGGTFDYQWQYREGAGPWIDIAGSNSATYTEATGLTTNREYRRAAQSTSGCDTVYSDTITITVYGQLQPGSIGFSQSICYDSIPAPFTSVVGASGGGTFDYEWQYREGAGPWIAIAGSNSATYTETTGLTTNREYRRAAQSTSGCNTVYSDTITITVYGQLQPGSIGSDQSICYDSVPAPFTSVAAASGGGTFDYEWQYREGAGPWVAIAGSNSAAYTETTGLTTNREYRRAAQSTSGCNTVYSDTITITVYGQLQPGSIGSDQTICYDSVPAPFTSTVDASGGGTFDYEWQYREGAGPWIAIAGSNSATYTETTGLTTNREYRRAAQSTSGCNTVYSDTIIITVYGQLQPGSIGFSQSICYDSIPAPFTSVAAASGGGTFDYQWEYREGAGPWVAIAGSNSATYTEASGLTTNREYRRAAQSTSGCNTVYSDTITITVYGQLQPGSIGSDQSICYDSVPAPFTSVVGASGGGTFDYQWEYREGAGPWIAIAASNSATYAETTGLTTNREYRRAAQSTSGCDTVYSDTITITVYGQLQPGSIGSDQTICYDSVPAPFTSIVGASGGGTFDYQWQYREGAGPWVAIAGSNSAAYTETTGLTTNREYRRAAQSTSGCNTVYSDTISITVYGQLQPGSIGSDQSICYDSVPAPFTSIVDASGGGTFDYEWQYREGAGPWISIAGSNSATFTETTGLTTDREYRRAAQSTSGCNTVYSDTITITVYGQLQPGSIGSDQTICYDSVPAPFTSIVDASGGGSFDYQWQYREGAGPWIPIAGSNSATYTETTGLTTDREYRRAAQSTSGCNTVYSDTITITVYGQLQPGSIGSDQTICYDSVPAPFTSIVDASGGGTFDYEWQYREGAGPWISIAGSNNATYTETTGLTTDREYRRAAQSTSGCDTVYSDTITITVYGELLPGSIGSDQSICYDSVPAPFTSIVDASGGGTLDYQWQYREGAGPWISIAGSNSASYTETTGLTTDREYRRAAQSTSGCDTVYSDTITITVYGQLQPGSIGSDQTVCYDSIPAPFTSVVGASGGGSFDYQWQYREGAGPWISIAGSNSATYTETTGLTTDREYRRAAQSTSGCDTVYSDTIAITVYGQLQPGSIGSDQTICYDSVPAPFTSVIGASGGGSFDYQWQYREGIGPWIAIPGTNNATYTETTGLTTDREYRRAAQSTSGCDTVYSDTITITVYGQLQPGSIGSDQTVCYDSIPAPFTSVVGASGGGSFDYQWQYREGAGPWIAIAGSNSATYTETTGLTTDREYRRAAQSTSGCDTVYSDTITITVYGQLQPGSIGSDQTICYDSVPAPFTSVVGASGGGSFDYQWQYREGAGPWIAIAGSNSATYTETTGLTTDREYRRAAQSTSGCDTVYSDTITITVYGQLQPGSIGSDQSICYDSVPAPFTSVVGASGGGTFDYQWQYREGAGPWIAIAGSNSATYTETAGLTISREYRRAAQSTSGCDTVYSDTIAITVYGKLQPGSIGSDQSVCYDSVPAPFTSVVDATGGGTIVYQWEFREGAGPWIPILASNAADYVETSSLTANREYRRAAMSASGCDTVYSDTIAVIVYPDMVPGSIASSQTICYNSSPLPFLSLAPASGGGTFNYQWQYSEVAGVWTDITGAQSATFADTSKLTQDREYRRAVVSLDGCGTKYSDTVLITISPEPTAYAGPNDTVCYSEVSYQPLLATATDYTSIKWNIISGNGAFNGGIDNILDPVYIIDAKDRNNGKGSVVKLEMVVLGNNGCSSRITRDTLDLLINSEIGVNIGEPAPFYISANTKIEVCISTNNHFIFADLGVHLRSPDQRILTLHRAVLDYDPSPVGNCLTRQNADSLCFTTEKPLADSLEICDGGAVPIEGYFGAANVWDTLFGKDPKQGGWSVLISDTDDLTTGGIDGEVTSAYITFTDTAIASRKLAQVQYEANSIAVPIIDNDTAIITIQRDIKVSCYGECDAQAIVSTVGGIQPYSSYNWTPSPFGGNGADSVSLCAGVYNLEVEDAIGCKGNTSVTVLEPNQIIVTQANYVDSLTCSADTTSSIEVKAAGGTGDLTFILMRGTDTLKVEPDSGYFYNLAADTYSVNISDETGCSIDTSFTIWAPEPISFDTAYVADSVFCFGDNSGVIHSVGTGGTAPYTYVLLQGTVPVDTITHNDTAKFSGLTPGNYFVKVTDSNKCDTVTSNVLVMNSPAGPLAIDTIISPVLTCFGTKEVVSVIINGGVKPYEVTLDDGTAPVVLAGIADTASFNDVGMGTYDIRIRDAKGCQLDSIGHSVVGPAALLSATITATPVPNTSCPDDKEGKIEIQASGGWGKYEYSIDGLLFDTINEFNNLGKGKYYLYIRDSLGCIILDSSDVDGPYLEGNPTVTDVNGSSLGSIRLDPYAIQKGTQSTSPLFRIWFSDTKIPDASRTYQTLTANKDTLFPNLTAGTYYAAIKDANNCLWESTLTVLENKLNAEVIAYNPICSGWSGALVVKVGAGATKPVRLYLRGSVTPSKEYDTVPVNDSIIMGVATGNMDVRIVDGNGASYDTTVTYINPPAISYSYSDMVQKTCRTEDLNGNKTLDGEIHVLANGGSGANRTYELWLYNSGTQDFRKLESKEVPANDTCKFTELGQYADYNVRVFDSLGCSARGDTFEMIGLHNFYSYLPYRDTLCKYGTIELVAGGGNGGPEGQTVNREWFPDTLFEDLTAESQLFTMLNGDIKIGVRLYDDECQSINEAQLFMFDTVGMNLEFVGGDIIYDSVRKTIVYSDKDDIAFKIPGDYHFAGWREDFCNQWIIGEDTVDHCPEPGSRFELIKFLPGTPSDSTHRLYTVLGDSASFYSYGYTNDGCVEYSSYLIQKRSEIQEDDVYTVFTPNGDGINDEWTIENADQFPDFEIEIYNRWGQLVYFHKGYGFGDSVENKWDGKSIKGKDLPVGTYYYIINPNDGNTKPFSGTVTIIR